jgi:penicillin G amidase
LDWTGTTKLPSLPFVINPEKGYIVAANSRVMSDSSVFEYGATTVPTARQNRITELIDKFISNNEKLDIKDMIEIQND